MFRIFTRRKGRTWMQSGMLFLVLALSCFAKTAIAEEEWKRCLDKTDVIPQTRNFRYNEETLNITLEMSSRITHQLATHIFRIILQEQLGYARVKIVEYDDYDADHILDRMDCIELGGRSEDKVPETIINLDVPVPIDYPDMGNPCVKELGSLLPAGRFGWFIPQDLIQPIKQYDSNWYTDAASIPWTFFRDHKFVTPFDITGDYKTLLDDNAFDATRHRFYCNETRCSKGWYIPEQCKGNSNKNVGCAVLLAPDYESTKDVIDHIDTMKIYVKVVWLGKNLKQVSDEIKLRYKKNKLVKSLLIMSWTPGEVIFNPQDYVMVNMKRCEFTNVTGADCFYEKRRSVKYAWNEVEVSASHVYELLKNINFMDVYRSLIDLYDEKKNDMSTAEIGCEWTRTNFLTMRRFWVPNLENVVYIGGIFPISGSTYVGTGIVKGALMATDAVNRNMSILPNFNLNLLVADGQCRADKVMKTFIDYITQKHYPNLIGVLGPACSETVEPLAGVSKYYKTVTISYSAEGAFFSDRDKYPYFFRTIGENKHYKYVYLELLKSLGWKRVAALTEDGQKYTEYISHMQDMLEANDITFISNAKFPREREKDAMTRYLEDLQRKRARIIIADVFGEVARNVMCEAYKLHMTAKQGYVWFLPIWLNNTWYDTSYFNHHFNESVNCTTANMMEAINGYFAMTHAYFADDEDIMQENITVGEWKQNYITNVHDTNIESSNYAGYAYDAVWTYALALNKLIKEDPEAMNDLHSANVTNKLTQIIKDIDFNGVSGRIKFRGGTTRFSIINIMQWYNNESRLIGRFHPNISDTSPDILGGYLDLNKSAIVWLAGKKPDDGTKPPEVCTLNSLAKFFNVKCDVAIIILFMFVICVVVLILVSFILFLKKTYDKKVSKTEKYMESLGLQHLLATVDYNGLDKWEIEREFVVLNRKLGEGAFGTVYGGEAKLPSDTLWIPVAVKTLKIGSTTEEKLDFLSEAEVMKRFDHKNIVKLLGVCTKVEPVYTVMEFMLYGDLKNYLLARRHLVNGNNVDESEEVSSKKLTAMALDVARGLSYLAELKYVHRDVASRNCLLNEQRVVKLGDFGLTRPMLENDYYKFNRRGMMPVRWMSPESLELGVFTPASDVWSYGVLLYEIITFGSFPFQGLSNAQVLNYVKAGNTIAIPQGVRSQLEILLKTCWLPNPSDRPTASQIVDYLANNSRLISPCLDAPLSSVQMDDTGQLEMQLPDQFRKCSSSLSFKNLAMVNGLSSLSTPVRRQPSVQGDSGVSIQTENSCPKEPLLPERSDSISGCIKHVVVQHNGTDSGCDQDENDYFGSVLEQGFSIV